jgi:1-acyl-sn-glycerol-3-phosphate acyltransferase
VIKFRSIVFYGLFYLSNALQMIFWTPVFFFIPRKEAWKVCKAWAYSHLWLQNKICGSTYDFRGLENLDPHRSQLIGSKHQSAWETYTMILFFDDPGYILKRILIYIPLFGWYMQKMKVVPVDRGKRALALASMTKNTRQHMAERNRQVIIYPEGTRTKAGAAPKYKYGITHLYGELNVPVQPVALNSGIYWGRAALLIYPGEIIMEFLEPIEPGLSKDDFATLLRERIETASDRLIEEAIHSDNPPPLAQELGTKMQVA